VFSKELQKGKPFTGLWNAVYAAYMKDLPYERVEAALVDGAGQWRAFLVVVLPLTFPVLITLLPNK